MEGWSHKKVAKGQKMKLPSVEDLQITIRRSVMIPIYIRRYLMLTVFDLIVL